MDIIHRRLGRVQRCERPSFGPSCSLETARIAMFLACSIATHYRGTRRRMQQAAMADFWKRIKRACRAIAEIIGALPSW